MISLFDKNAKYTEDAMSLDVAILKAIEPIMRNAAEKGFSVRDIYTVTHLVAVDIMNEIILDNDVKEGERRKLARRKLVRETANTFEEKV